MFRLSANKHMQGRLHPSHQACLQTYRCHARSRLCLNVAAATCAGAIKFDAQLNFEHSDGSLHPALAACTRQPTKRTKLTHAELLTAAHCFN
jgi:hypothetical protein